MNEIQRSIRARRSAEHGMIGWIANSETMLFGLLIALTLAVVARARLSETALARDKVAQQLHSQESSLDSLTSQVARLEDQLANAGVDANDFAFLLSEYCVLSSELDDRERNLQSSRLQLRRVQAELEQSQQDLASASKKLLLASGEQDMDVAAQRASQRQVHRELLGVRGPLNNVVFVIDASGSMKTGGRWSDALKVLDTWLRHLKVTNCAVLVYNSSIVLRYPSAGGFLHLSEQNEALFRAELVEALQGITPQKGTNTYDALRAAYAYPQVDTIVLFTDGAPTRGGPTFSPEEAQKIYVLIGANKGIPINAVGLGNYFESDMSTFLLRVAKDSGGMFIGR